MTSQPLFTSQPLLRQKTVGEKLSSAREERGYSVEEVSRLTKINTAHINALEKGRYADLPSAVYVRSYLQVYCRTLGLSWANIEPQYKKEIAVLRTAPVAQHEEKKQILPQKRLRSTAQKIQAASTHEHKKAVIVPRLIRMGIVALVIVIVAVYITSQIVRIYNPPPLTITSPTSDVQVSEDQITISGMSAPEAVVEINDQEANVAQDGSFTVDLFLREGLNTIRISTHSQRSKKREVVRYILYVPPVEEESLR